MWAKRIDQATNGNDACGMKAAMMSVHLGKGFKATGTPKRMFYIDTTASKGSVKGEAALPVACQDEDRLFRDATQIPCTAIPLQIGNGCRLHQEDYRERFADSGTLGINSDQLSPFYGPTETLPKRRPLHHFADHVATIRQILAQEARPANVIAAQLF